MQSNTQKICYSEDHISTLEYCHERGWAFTPLNGKKPILKGWQKLPREDKIHTVADWTEQHNIGLRTGQVSGGIIVVDADINKGADISKLDLPDTVQVSTGGGIHYYYHYDQPMNNSAGKIGPCVNCGSNEQFQKCPANDSGPCCSHIDTRGDGGQVVFPGSIHPDTGQPYDFIDGFAPWQIKIAPLPEWIIDALSKPKKTQSIPKGQSTAQSTAQSTDSRYAQTALKLETAAVRGAPEGTRNDTLNKAAFSLGQLVGSNALSRADVEWALLDAAISSGLHENEARATIRSGVDSGIQQPREIPEPKNGRQYSSSHTASKHTDSKHTDSNKSEIILAPGAYIDDIGNYIEQTSKTFAQQVINALPEDAIYRRSHIPGEVRGIPGKMHWDSVDENDMRLIIDDTLYIRAWAKSKSEECQVLIYKPCIKDLAGLVIAEARKHANIRELEFLAPYPFYTPGWRRAVPGWFDGYYYDEPPELSDIQPVTDIEEINNALEDLVADFPFATEADRQNYFGLMLTPIIMPAVNGNRPMHLIMSSRERTGKSKLAGDVLGGVILGRQTPALQITAGRGSDEERDKRLLALLLTGSSLVHFDNLPHKVDSVALASALTSETYQGRILGASKIPALKNNLTIVASGNNTECSGEIAKRTIPIILQPRESNPEDRRGFMHPNLHKHVQSVRKHVLACLLGMVENWLQSGSEPHERRLGGFESWSESVGGILRANGMNKWRSNEKVWQSQSDYEGLELEAFVQAWWDRYGSIESTSTQLLEIAQDNGLFEWLQAKETPRARSTSFGIFLRKIANRPVKEWVIKKRGVGAQTQYKLEAMYDVQSL